VSRGGQMIRVHGLCARWGTKRGEKKGCWKARSENTTWLGVRKERGSRVVWGSFVL
jgi:hypothetical protein